MGISQIGTQKPRRARERAAAAAAAARAPRAPAAARAHGGRRFAAPQSMKNIIPVVMVVPASTA